MTTYSNPHPDLLLKIFIVLVEKNILNPNYSIFLFCLFKQNLSSWILGEGREENKEKKENTGKKGSELKSQNSVSFLSSSGFVKLTCLDACDASRSRKQDKDVHS